MAAAPSAPVLAITQSQVVGIGVLQAPPAGQSVHGRPVNRRKLTPRFGIRRIAHPQQQTLSRFGKFGHH